MRFAPSVEQQEFAQSLRRLLNASDTPAVIRSWASGDPLPGRKLWSRLYDHGVLALAIPEERGGPGGSPIDLVIGFIELGRAAVPGPLVESAVVLPALGVDPDDDRIATLAVPPHVPYALDAGVSDAIYLVDDGALFTARIVRQRASVDKARRLAAVAAQQRIAMLDPGPAVRLGVLTTAAYVHGAGQALLQRAIAYAKQRTQFGKPIGSFQAVQHLLVDAAVALEMSGPLLFGAALGIGTPTADRDVSAAKVACTDAAYRAARTALQVHGAIGYTAEYDLALWLTKVRALTSAWGTQRVHRNRVLTEIRSVS
jgi:alkylation response protein AidB-like acyl-CoA dehydrogenase